MACSSRTVVMRYQIERRQIPCIPHIILLIAFILKLVEKQISELNYEIREQISLALNSHGIAGDRNYIHLVLRLGIPEDVIRNLAGMMEVFGHLKMRRVTIGELLRTLRIMERHDVVNMMSGAILDGAGCFVESRHNPDSSDGGDDVFGPPEQEQGSITEKEFPYPVQECIA